jgi:hypothetical protein
VCDPGPRASAGPWASVESVATSQWCHRRERRGGVSRPAPPTWPEVAWLSPSWPGRAEARRASWRGLEGARRASWRGLEGARRASWRGLEGARRASWRGLEGARRAWSPGPGASRAGRSRPREARSRGHRRRTSAEERLRATERVAVRAKVTGWCPWAAIRYRRRGSSGRCHRLRGPMRCRPCAARRRRVRSASRQP